MNKGKIYTLFVFTLSFTVICGSWLLTKEMLNRKEAEILAQTGQISMEAPENEDGDESSQDAPVTSGEFKGENLSEDMMAQILSVWESGGRELLHEPSEGQINMEQAIDIGRDWIGKLSQNNILPAYLSDSDFDNTNAVLCTLDKHVSIDEALISYWRITYVKDDVRINLVIHAVIGQVWSADISMSGDKSLFEDCSDEELLAIAFPFMNGENAVLLKVNNANYVSFPEGKVYARLKKDDVAINKQEPVAHLMLNLCTDIIK